MVRSVVGGDGGGGGDGSTTREMRRRRDSQLLRATSVGAAGASTEASRSGGGDDGDGSLRLARRQVSTGLRASTTGSAGRRYAQHGIRRRGRMSARTWCFDASQSHWTRARGCVGFAAAELCSSLESRERASPADGTAGGGKLGALQSPLQLQLQTQVQQKDGRKETGWGVDFLDALALALGEFFQRCRCSIDWRSGAADAPCRSSHFPRQRPSPFPSSHEPRPPLPLLACPRSWDGNHEYRLVFPCTSRERGAETTSCSPIGSCPMAWALHPRTHGLQHLRRAPPLFQGPAQLLQRGAC